MNKQLLKKHHFWILTGLVPLIVLIAFLLITSGVGGAIENNEAALKKANDQLQARKIIKPTKLINELTAQTEELKKKQGEMWQKNWAKQKEQFTWPKSEILKPIADKDIAFGDPIPNQNSELDVFKGDIYTKEYERMAASVAPTQFLGDGPKDPGWKKVLRYVADWGPKVPDSSTVWMALEDIWVQRTLLGAVKTVNDQIASFTPPVQDKLLGSPVPHYKCKSRLWEVELWIEQKGSEKVLRGKLKNITDRLQILGVGNTLRLQVWLTNSDLNDESRAFEFPIEGEFVRANSYAQAQPGDKDQAPVIKELPAHHIKAGTPANGIFKVRQKFDVRTVPVRMIEEIRLNSPDSRHANKIQVPLKEEKKAENATPSMAGEGGEGGVRPVAPVAPPIPGAGPTGTATGTGGSVEAVILANKNRYLIVTQQVRRMGVKMNVAMDQMFVEDFLVALANMPLRFQTTQVGWTRFRGTLPSMGSAVPGGAAPSSDGSDAPVRSTEGTVQGSGFIIPGGDPYRGITRPGLPRPMTPNSPMGPTGTLSSVSEGQLTAGLVTVSVHGIISMYMKYTEAPAATASAD